MRYRKSTDVNYQTAYFRKWSSEGRTILALKKAGYTVVRFVPMQRKKRHAFATDEPKTSGLIAADGKSGSKIVIVTSGRKVTDARRKSLAEFGRRMKPIAAIEVWTWPIMARQPEIERIA